MLSIAKSRTKFKVSTTAEGVKDRQSTDYYTGETILFMSKLEKQFYTEVVLSGMKDGSIIKYELQHKYLLQPSFKYMGKTILAINYISDFDLTYFDGRFEVIDVKGMATPEAGIKAKIFKNIYPNTVLRWLSYTKATGWIDYYDLQKIQRNNKKLKQTKKDEG